MALKNILLVLTSLFLTSPGFSQSSLEIENQCRTEAKEVALKSYQACISGKKAAQLESLRLEYQDKISKLKDEYDSKVKDLIQEPAMQTKPENKISELENGPTVVLKKAKVTSSKKSVTKQNKIKKNLKEALPQETSDSVIITPTVQEELNEITKSTENLEMVDPTLVQE